MVSGRPRRAGTGTGYDGRARAGGTGYDGRVCAVQEVQSTMQEVQGTMVGCEHEVHGGYGHEVRLYRLYL